MKETLDKVKKIEKSQKCKFMKFNDKNSTTVETLARILVYQREKVAKDWIKSMYIDICPLTNCGRMF